MCGITGFINLDLRKPNINLLKRMTDVVSYRGPDDSGLVISDNCALGHRRLAIIDLSSGGHQPMWDYKKRLCIVFNGEIYNYRQLRERLVKRGYRFLSQSDVEVALNHYQEFGPSGLNDLRGQFSFAIWNRKNGELFLARDQFGIKPLQYFLDDQVFIFGSEIKSLLLHHRVKKSINYSALSDYFSIGFGCVPSPKTIFNGIYKLPPAHWAILKNKQLIIKKYWDLSLIKPVKATFQESMVETKKRLKKSVERQLVADVPIGCFLSGGIDSSLITALAQQSLKRPIKTFSIGFEDRNFDETKFALKVADNLKTEHFYQKFTSKELLKTLPKIVNKLDEPFGDGSILPTYLLSEITRKQVKVALSGDGGDELFAGYPTYLAHKLSTIFNFLPAPILSLARASIDSEYVAKLAAKFIPFLKHSPNLSTRFKLERFFNGLDKNLARQYLNFIGPISLKKKERLLVYNQETAESLVADFIVNVKDRDLLTQLLYLDFKLYLSEDGLVKTDHASSYNSLEVRPPFLDVDLAEFLFSLPSVYKIKGFTLKYLLKKIAADFLPKEIINRPKKGFGIPTHYWLRNQLKPQLKSLLETKKLKSQGLFNSDCVKEILKEHLNGTSDHRMVLWNLFIFQLWYDRWFKN